MNTVETDIRLLVLTSHKLTQYSKSVSSPHKPPLFVDKFPLALNIWILPRLYTTMNAGRCSICRQTPAVHSCPCVSPSLIICARCIEAHLQTTGRHNPVPYERTEPEGQVENEVCSVCMIKTAVCFCLCSTPLRKFCEQCDISHYQKAPLMTHSKHPILAYQAVATGQVPILTFCRKQFYINDLQFHIGEELTHFDAFAKQTREELDEFTSKVAAQREKILRDLETLRGELVLRLKDIQEVIAAKRYAEAFEVVTELDEYIKEGYLTTAEYSLKMFTGKHHLAEICESLDKAVVYELAPNRLLEEADKGIIPVVNATNLRLFHPATFQMNQIALSQVTKIDQYTAYCYIRTDTILCCGGGTCHSEVYEINVKTGRVETAPNMNSPRYGAGIWCTKKQIFVFGGCSRASLNTAEKYGLARKPWVNIANVMPKAMNAVSVCEHSSGLYLSGFDGTGASIVHFNLDTEAFKLLRFDTPGHSLLCCLEDELYYIKQGTIETANLSRGLDGLNFAVTGTFPKVGNGNYWLCCPMKFKAGKLVSVLNSLGTVTGLFSFTPAKSQFTQVATFTY